MPFTELHEQFPPGQMPLLQRAKRRAIRTRPYAGLRVLHNVPLTPETVLKIEVLTLGGAELLVTNPSFVAPDPRSVALLERAGIEFRAEHRFPAKIDVALDCGGELCALLTPSVGACELTGTGSMRYRAADPSYPVITVDESRVKDLEALLGTGRSFVHAFRQLVAEPIDGQPFLVVGYGKVGQGIVRALRPHTGMIGVVDADPAQVAAASRAGCDAMRADETDRVEAWAQQAFAVVTATGVRGVVAANYDPAAFLGSHLANMGAEDEFGEAFARSDVLADKNPVNFAVSTPELVRYLDPVFAAHNLGIDLLLFAQLGPGVHPFPGFLAEEIVDDWQRAFGERIDPE